MVHTVSLSNPAIVTVGGETNHTALSQIIAPCQMDKVALDSLFLPLNTCLRLSNRLANVPSPFSLSLCPRDWLIKDKSSRSLNLGRVGDLFAQEVRIEIWQRVTVSRIP